MPLLRPGSGAFTETLPRIVTLSLRRLLAVVVLCFAIGLVLGLGLHHPTKETFTPQVLEAMRSINAQADRVLAEQRLHGLASGVTIQVSPNPSPPGGAGVSRAPGQRR
jgi:hypothetical protein